MAWFRNKYACTHCDTEWDDEWSCMCDDDCRHCGARHIEPYDSIDLTDVIEHRGDAFLILRSPDSAEDKPGYRIVVDLPTREEAEAFVRQNIM
jgi:hypothetical protein